ncbi:MAG: hypothetical protein Q7T56_09075 [Nocardioidaceae bacterium]|nr:hypothetical protein [Nocardioidaceae bacterium]
MSLTPTPPTDSYVGPRPSHRPLDVCLTVAVDDSASSVDVLVREMGRAQRMDAELRVVPVHPLAGMTDAAMARMVAVALSRVAVPPRVSCPSIEVAP